MWVFFFRIFFSENTLNTQTQKLGRDRLSLRRKLGRPNVRRVWYTRAPFPPSFHIFSFFFWKLYNFHFKSVKFTSFPYSSSLLHFRPCSIVFFLIVFFQSAAPVHSSIVPLVTSSSLFFFDNACLFWFDRIYFYAFLMLFFIISSFCVIFFHHFIVLFFQFWFYTFVDFFFPSVFVLLLVSLVLYINNGEA